MLVNLKGENFMRAKIRQLFCLIVVPAVNQVETHVFQQQKVAREYLEKHNTQIMSWGPFAKEKMISSILRY